MTPPTSPTSPISPWPPEPSPPAHPNSKEAYGFFAATTTSILAVFYLIWALVPGSTLEAFGIEWYPKQEWAILVPAWSMVLIWVTYFAYGALMLLGTPPLTSLALVTDHRANLLLSRTPEDDSPSPIFRYARRDVVPEAWDVPLGVTNRVLYGRRKRRRRPSAGENVDPGGGGWRSQALDVAHGAL